MADGLLSLKDFLLARPLPRNNGILPMPHARRRLEESLLFETMRDICVEINREAGTVIVDEHHYLPPEPVISSYTFTKGRTEYVMRLELWGPRPCLVFVT